MVFAWWTENGSASTKNWKGVYKRKEFEGLGIINIWDFNTALLLNWWWKLFDKSRHKWAPLIFHSYRPSTGWWSDRCIDEGSSSFWKGLRSVNELFFLTIAMDVGNGRGTRSGLINSVQISLWGTFPRSFSLSQDLTGSVVSYWLNGCWIIKVPESGLGDLIAKRKELCSSCYKLLRGIFRWTLGLGTVLVGSGTQKRFFSVWSAYCWLNNDDLHYPFAKVIYALLRLAINSVILTWYNIRK